MSTTDAPRPVIRVTTSNVEIQAMWEHVYDITLVLPYERWVLIGGLMVRLQALRAAPAGQLRSTFDVDVLADSRAKPSGTEVAAELLLRDGFRAEEPYGAQEPFTVHRFTKGELAVDILGPDGMNGANAPRTQPPSITFPVSGGTQALRRAEVVDVRVAGREPMLLRTPSLVGAVLLKARSVAGATREKDRGDLAMLLSCVDDPLTFRDKLSKKERGWLAHARTSLRPEDPELEDIIGRRRAQLARQAFALVSR